VLIDQGARVEDRVLALARALAELQTERIYMRPAARELVEAIQIRGTYTSLKSDIGGRDSTAPLILSRGTFDRRDP
jgi:hypothetical protein